MRKAFRYFMIIVGILLILRGVLDLGLYTSGTITTGYIGYSSKNFSSRGSSTYTAHYSFTLPDKSLCTGEGTVGSRSGREPTGSIKIAYYSIYPNFNYPYGSGLIFYFLIWSIIGVVIIVLNIKGLKKLNKIIERSKRIFNSDNPYKNGDIKSNFTTILVIIIFVVIGCTLYFKFLTKSNVSVDISKEEKYGNAIGNTVNDGNVLVQNNKIFYVNWNDDHKLYSMNLDFTGLKKIEDTSVSCLNGKDGWIYYTDFKKQDKIYKIKEDGSKKTSVYKWKSEDVNLYGDFLYFANGNDHSRLYKVDIDGNHESKLNNDECQNVLVYKGYIYYHNKTDFDSLYKIRIDGKDRQKISKMNLGSYIIDKDKIYFSNKSDDNKLYYMDLDGKNTNKLADEKVGFLNSDGENIYYSDFGNDGALAKMKINGSEIKKMHQLNPFTINLTNNSIIFEDFFESGKLFSIGKDGENLIQLPDKEE